MRILILGKGGQLGWELARAVAPLGEVISSEYPEIDLNKPEGVRSLIRQTQPRVILNATAYTDVDKAESEPTRAMAINAYGPGILAEEAKRVGAGLIHYSTDYVFDGRQERPYVESDAPRPLSVYGQSKLAGEQWIQGVGESYLILRTSWLYSLRRPSFVTKVLGWSRQQKTLRIVSDQISNPTWVRFLAEATALALAQGLEDPVGWLAEKRGLYHLAGSGHTSRYEWARAVLDLDPCRNEQVVEKLEPALTADFPTPAERPLFSALSCDLFTRMFNLVLPDWRVSLQIAME